MDELIVTYTETDTPVLLTARFDGVKWKEAEAIKIQNRFISSRTAPGAALLNNWLYIVYKPLDSDDLHCAWFNGVTWDGGIPIKSMPGGIAPRSNTSPQIAVHNGILHVVYLPTDTSCLHHALFDGNRWSGGTEIIAANTLATLQTDINPGICAYKNNLYIVFNILGKSELYIAWFNGVIWVQCHAISSMPGNITPHPEWTTPAMAEYRGLLYLAYNGPESNIYTCIFDGTRWSGNTKISQSGGIDPTSIFGPGLQAFNDKLCLVYVKPSQASTRYNDLFASYFDGLTWRGTKVDTVTEISMATKTPIRVSVASPIPKDQSKWLSALPDNILIGDINLPGSHEAPAINGYITTPYACQNLSITRQLQCGIRILDVRLQVSQVGAVFNFMTCHGFRGSSVGLNVYQSLTSLMDECKEFLIDNARETILIILKVDDWSGMKGDVQLQAAAALEILLRAYPTTSSSGSMPTLGALRGRILLYNRITNDPELGVPLDWAYNTDGSYADPVSGRPYKVFVQDKFESLDHWNPWKDKYKLVTTAFGKQRSGEVVLNFASATRPLFMGVYIMDYLLNYFGQKAAPQRPSKFGWVMLDYGLDNYHTDVYWWLNLVTIVIASNFGYNGYEQQFRVTGHEDL